MQNKEKSNSQSKKKGSRNWGEAPCSVIFHYILPAVYWTFMVSWHYFAGGNKKGRLQKLKFNVFSLAY